MCVCVRVCIEGLPHHSQQPPLLLEGGAASKHARHHDDGAGQHQDVGGGGVGLGGQQADVLALLHQRPDAHAHHHAPRQLGDRELRHSPGSAGPPLYTALQTALQTVLHSFG